MPELPEVETIKRQLNERLVNKRIIGVEVIHSGREFPREALFIDQLKGRKIIAVKRRAKLLIFYFMDGGVMTAHLKMTGKFLFAEKGYEPKKHDHILFYLDDGSIMIWSDVRKFGFVNLLTDEQLEDEIADYGPEPLEHEIQILADALKRHSTRAIKSVLLDQKVIAGIGNIYADESLFRARIHPSTRAHLLTDEQRFFLAKEIQLVLTESIEQKGTSANDYIDTQGERGGFLSLLRVYGRAGEKCVSCKKTTIQKITQAGRGTHFCPKCQIA
ncbi:MAG: bifunctional DNA-formamidopyrimidine glycosylase/DNA-(apurinic or apyrimidinic site) lyase [Candidatus Magasanikbacteria bacterium]|nr:bifunctional DNA-formamidopyrimidine glycosylase/DNA-(apurinic or apyrimidinic site) lyase [Candidatus Magasanikbacteria bacterium]